jgi:uncharacterized OsmC-like protein
MDRDTFRAIQGPLKALYAEQPERALAVLRAEGEVDFERLGCRVRLLANDGCDLLAGLHVAAGGDGLAACSGELLLQALVTCAGTTLAAVAKALGVRPESCVVAAEGLMDFRGTLGVDRTTAVGLTGVELKFEFAGEIAADTMKKLVELSERYCVVLQTLRCGVSVQATAGVGF